MNQFLFPPGTRSGMFGGIFLVVLANIFSGDLLKTAVLAAVAALVSFLMSHLLRMLVPQKKA